MGLLNPIFLLLAFLIAAVFVFYMFRKRYENKKIPSNILWEQVMNEWQASPWIDKLQRNLLLFLQLLILFLLMLALVRPYWMAKGIVGDHIIIVIDTSASMSALHDGLSRFDEAKREISTIIKDIGNQEVTIIAAGSAPTLLINKETNIEKIHNVVDEINLSYEYSDMDKAIRLANSLAVNEESSLFIFSDSVKKEDLKDISETTPISVFNMGKDGENVSLKSFGIGEKDHIITGISVIENQSNEQKTAILQINSNENILFEEKVELAPGEQKFVRIPKLPAIDYYKAIIYVEDDYSVDNALIAINQPSLSKVYLVGDISPFIMKGLENIGYETIQIKEADINTDLSDGIVVVENLPMKKWPKRPLLAITPNKVKEIRIQSEIKTEKDPVFQYVNFNNTYVQSAFTGNENNIPVIASSADIPLIQKGTANGFSAIVIQFSIEKSDWPLQTGFPIFLYQSFQWLASNEDFFGFFLPGEKRWLNIDAENKNWKVFNEKGKFIDSFNLLEESFTAPHRPGLYQTVVNEKTTYFAVNLDDREKMIPYSSPFSINQPKQHSDHNSVNRIYDGLWFWFVFIALIILFIEWEVMRRGTRV
ncbi:VWA domain-containing protein [Bacillus sp. FJAT-49711]|uniref:vWA domain-containing protein n=1 Tax=Bacillus sp. FJAT-49711 TaxID=2833585 RepID=UPI001BCA2403|nr:BatA and WFA domain-containing protein [Bacillus sp. FJAT-49711]MBS4217922.1 VWA domain-containing protein [Bacillus sp. FJAT-49711]